MLTLDKIYQASYALKTVIRRTDLISAPNINPESHIFLKPENLQVTGSFKVRGACFKIAQLITLLSLKSRLLNLMGQMYALSKVFTMTPITRLYN